MEFAPALIFLLLEDKKKSFANLERILACDRVGALLASPFLIPFLHFSHNFVKNTDPVFKEAQPLAFLPLNLVIDDLKYYQSDVLGKFPFPSQYNLYIGWISVLLAIFGIAKGRWQDRKLFWFMGSGIFLAFLMGSAEILKWLVRIWPAVAGVRNPAQIASLAVPLILGFSAYGLEQLLSLVWDWPSLSLGYSDPNTILKWQIPLQWVLYIPLIFSMVSVYNFSKDWIYTVHIANDVDALLSTMKTNSLEWVEPPFGEHFWIPTRN